MAFEIAGYGLEDSLPYINVSLMDIIIALVALAIGVIIVKIVAGSIRKALLRMHVTPIMANFLARLLRVILYIFVIGFALSFVGYDLSAALISLSVVMGLVLGFALGDVLANVASGFMIAITRPFRVGDYVEIGGTGGTVHSVGASLTELKTPDNKYVIIPNKVVWSSTTVNYTLMETRRVDMLIGVAYSTDLDKAIKVTLELVKADARVLPEPEPMVAVKEMADSSVNLVIRPWVKTDDYWPFFWDFKKALKQTYDREGIEIPFPQRDINMHQAE